MISYEMNGKIVAEFDKDESFAISRLTGEQVETLAEMVFERFSAAIDNGTNEEIFKWKDLYDKVSKLFPVKWAK